MERKLAKDRAKSQLKNYLENKGIRTSKPFRCLSRDHEDKSPSMSYDKNQERVHCFGCGFNADIFDLVGDEYGLIDHKGKFDKTYELLGINIDKYTDSYDLRQQSLNDNNFIQYDKSKSQAYTGAEEIKENFTQFFLQVQQNISKSDCITYLSKRGISIETAKKYGLGYMERWQSPKALKANKTPPATPRIIIPTSEHSYLARDTREVIPEHQEKYSKIKEGKINMFNIDALAKNEPCFVVEGEFDALSFLEIGINAVALGSVSNTDLFLKKLEKSSTQCPLILALDADDRGKEAKKKLEEGLKKQNVKHIVFDLDKDNTGYNDPNEFLVGNRETFEKKVQECIKNFEEQLSTEAQADAEEFEIEKEKYFKTSVSHQMDGFRKSIELSKYKNFISTGFYQLDEVLDGGLFEGLYMIGAISSLGKTTFVIQIADYIASQGQDVLFFSLEMSMYEIMAKSVSRHTHWYCKENGFDFDLAKTARGITTGKKYEWYTQEDHAVIYAAEEKYKGYTNKLFIHEGCGDLGVKEVREKVENHIKYIGNPPVVVVDYLQILAPNDPRATDKQNIDKAVLELKRISRDYKIPVVAISSLNRHSYKDPISMASFKESGGIEYSSDVLIGLQLEGAGKDNFDVDKEKDENPRKIELKVLKNRNGKTGKSINFKYYTHFNFFDESHI